jgi:hypothetical protein
MLASIALVFVGAFILDNGILCISMLTCIEACCDSMAQRYLAVFVIIQYLAYTWYTLSYIPYARAGVAKFFGFG